MIELRPRHETRAVVRQVLAEKEAPASVPQMKVPQACGETTCSIAGVTPKRRGLAVAEGRLTDVIWGTAFSTAKPEARLGETPPPLIPPAHRLDVHRTQYLARAVLWSVPKEELGSNGSFDRQSFLTLCSWFDKRRTGPLFSNHCEGK
jgi:hypothetical protein